VLTTPVDRYRCLLVALWRAPAPGLFPARTAFPVMQAGRRPHLHFRGLLKLYTRYGLQGCSPTFRGLYREAPPWPVSRLGRSQAIKSYQQLLEWVLPPLVICPVGAHGIIQVSCSILTAYAAEKNFLVPIKELGLPSLGGKLPAYYSPGHRQHAEKLQRRMEDMNAFFSNAWEFKRTSYWHCSIPTAGHQ
jgi:hypothetical protein